MTPMLPDTCSSDVVCFRVQGIVAYVSRRLFGQEDSGRPTAVATRMNDSRT